jgi:hypothetical protein
MTILEIDVSDLSVASAEIDDERLIVTLCDGRIVSTPLAWYPRLASATTTEQKNYEIMPMGIHWPDLDEDLSIAGMLAGRRGV